MKEVPRKAHLVRIQHLLRNHPVVAILGARQIGKTTLAAQLARLRKGSTTVFDLEDPRNRARLAEPTLALEPLRGLVVLDEIQHLPELFPILRVLADRPRRPARFLVLGSANPALLRQGSETLAGRIVFHDLGGLDLEETGAAALERLWLRGGFPPSFLARSNRTSFEWRRAFVRTFVERDLPRLGVSIPPETLERFWTMLAHYHGQLWNGSELGRSLGVSHPTVRRYLDLLCSTYVVRRLLPWAENVGKRVKKSPKIFVADSGLFHTLLGLETRKDLEGHPKLGASWEGFLVDQIVRRLRARPEECFFWATQAGAELDLLIVRGRRRMGFEIKRTDAPKVTASMLSAMESLRLGSLTLVHAGKESFPLSRRIRAVAARHLLEEVAPLRAD